MQKIPPERFPQEPLLPLRNSKAYPLENAPLGKVLQEKCLPKKLLIGELFACHNVINDFEHEKNIYIYFLAVLAV